jgi:hypothetical protein
LCLGYDCFVNRWKNGRRFFSLFRMRMEITTLPDALPEDPSDLKLHSERPAGEEVV